MDELKPKLGSEKPTVIIRKPRKIHKIEDITNQDIWLLSKAYSLPEGQFMCFGMNYYRLEALGLISDENQITLTGKWFLHELTLDEAKKSKKQVSQ